MPVAINFKICDNAAECSGRAVCKTGAIGWDEEKKTLIIDNFKCISCGLCEKACMVQAIRVGRTEEEYQRILKEIEADQRKVSDLFADRYGATPIDPAFVTEEEDFGTEIESYPRLTVAELYCDESIECLLKSIPIKELLTGFNNRYRKVHIVSNILKDKYNIELLPCLVFMNDGRLVGKIEGYYDESRKEELKEKVRELLK